MYESKLVFSQVTDFSHGTHFDAVFNAYMATTR